MSLPYLKENLVELKDRVEKIFNHFEKIKREKPGCGKALCGTCGGYVGAIRESLDEDMRNEILEVFDAVEDMDIDSIQLIYKWEYSFRYLCDYDNYEFVHDKLRVVEDRMAPILEEKRRIERNIEKAREDRQRSIGSEEGKSLDLKDARKIYQFLLNYRSLYKIYRRRSSKPAEFNHIYESILSAGIELAIEKQDHSLIDKILYVLQDDARKYPRFFALASKSCPESVLEHCFTSYSKVKTKRIKDCFETLPEDEKFITLLDNPSVELQLKVVRRNGDLIRCIENPSLEVQLEAVRQNINSIRYIENPNQEVALEVANKNAILIKYVKNPTLELQLRAVKLNGFLIRYIENPSKEVQLEAVKKYGSSIKHIVNPSFEVQLEAVEQNGNSIIYIENPRLELQLKAVKDNSDIKIK